MQDYRVNLRIKNILQRICIETGYITIASIAKELNISTKTVLRELPEIEEWLQNYDCSLEKKTGVGIRLKGDYDKKQEILALLNGVINDEDYTPIERKIMIVSELLQNQEPVKLHNFTKTLKVTESTISNDLDKAEAWLKRHGVTLVRKPGFGIYIDGPEVNKRRAIISLIHENADDELMLTLIRNNSKDIGSLPIDLMFLTKTRLLNLIDNETIKKLESIIYETQKSMDYNLSDNAFIGLIVHLSLVIKRLSKNEKINMNDTILSDLKEIQEYLFAEKLAANISESFGIVIPEEEIGYITMHIKGVKNNDLKINPGNKTLGNFELVRLAKEIIRVAENETGYFLEQDERLLIGLVNHLGPTLSRLKMNLEIRNPLLENIKDHYPELVRVSEKCVKIIENQMHIKMPESEVAYIAMHLGAAIENNNNESDHVYRVMLACSAGIGTSMILSTRIEKEYDNIQIVDTISTLRLQEDKLKEEEIEFIISTVKIENFELPVVTVNPLLFEEDKNKITNMIKTLKNDNKLRIRKNKKHRNFKEKLKLLEIYSEAILQILENFFSLEDLTSIDIKGSIDKISQVISERDNINREKIQRALTEREEKGSIVLTGYQVVLFHCRTDAVDELHFGVLKIKNQVSLINGKDEQEEIKLGVVMLVPEGCSKYHIEVISYVSKMLIERPNFMYALKNFDKEEAENELSNILKDFYKMKVNN